MHCFSWEASDHFYHRFPIGNVSFFPLGISKDLFSLIFSNLMVMCLGVNLSWDLLSSWTCGFIFFKKIENWGAIIFSGIFLPSSISGHSSSTPVTTQLVDCTIMSQSLLWLCSLFFLVYFLPILWFAVYTDLTSSSLILSFRICNLLLNPSGKFFIWDTNFCQLLNPAYESHFLAFSQA